MKLRTDSRVSTRFMVVADFQVFPNEHADEHRCCQHENQLALIECQPGGQTLQQALQAAVGDDLGEQAAQAVHGVLHCCFGVILRRPAGLLIDDICRIFDQTRQY
ncbi:hypothetical protein UMZ34_13855 [Halopseudomonas pachastrellae]|nr:hypothetical protein UMZ34_13855 [Halopseudomonas pachastrellae]